MQNFTEGLRRAWLKFLDGLDDLPVWGKYALTALIAAVLALLISGCSTLPADDTVTAADLPPGVAAALGGCDTAGATAALVASIQKAKPSGEIEGCSAFPQGIPIDVSKCEALRGVYRDWEGDPFVTCGIGEGRSLIVWFFAPQPAPGRSL